MTELLLVSLVLDASAVLTLYPLYPSYRVPLVLFVPPVLFVPLVICMPPCALYTLYYLHPLYAFYLLYLVPLLLFVPLVRCFVHAQTERLGSIAWILGISNTLEGD